MKTYTPVSKEFEPITDITHPYMPKGIIKQELQSKDSKPFIFGTPEFNLLGTTEDESIASKMKEMKEGDIFFKIDSDVLMNAPAEWFVEQLGDNDIIFQNDENTYCLGFYVARVSPEVIRIFEKTRELTNIRENDQVIFNKIKDRFNLKLAFFDTNDVWNYGVLDKGIWNGEDFDLPKDIKAFHANFTIGIENKVKILKLVMSKLGKVV